MIFTCDNISNRCRFSQIIRLLAANKKVNKELNYACHISIEEVTKYELMDENAVT